MAQGPPGQAGPPPPGDLRLPPHNDDAERSLLGAVLLDPRSIDEVSSLIDVDDFYRESHRLIFRAMDALNARGDALDALTLSDYLRAEGTLDQVGGPTLLARLSTEVPSAANIVNYAQIVRRKSALRAFIRTADGRVEGCY